MRDKENEFGRRFDSLSELLSFIEEEAERRYREMLRKSSVR